MNEELISRIKTDLATVLLDVQSYANRYSLCNRNPEKWLKMATMICQGESTRVIRDECVVNGVQIKRVRAELEENPIFCDLKRELAVRTNMALADTMETNHLFSGKLKNRIENLSEAEMEEMDILELRKAEESGAKTAQILTNTMLRLRGDNVHKVHIVKTEGTLEDYFNALDKLNGNKETVMEAEEV